MEPPLDPWENHGTKAPKYARGINRMIRTKLASAAVVLGLIFAMPALAQTGSAGVFTIHNNTESNVVVGFYTNDGSGWSQNWLNANLDPGQQASAEFNAATGACAQTFQVGWLGENGGEVMDEPIDIDICEASNVYLDDNEIYFD